MIDFDARNNAFGNKIVGERFTIVGSLTGGFIEKDNTVDIIGEMIGSKKEVTIIATIVVSVGDLKLVKFFVNAATGFVSSQDPFRVEN